MGNEDVKFGSGRRFNQRVTDLNMLDDIPIKDYENENIYEEKIKDYNDQTIEMREFVVPNLVLLFNSWFHLF